MQPLDPSDHARKLDGMRLIQTNVHEKDSDVACLATGSARGVAGLVDQVTDVKRLVGERTREKWFPLGCIAPALPEMTAPEAHCRRESCDDELEDLKSEVERVDLVAAVEMVVVVRHAYLAVLPAAGLEGMEVAMHIDWQPEQMIVGEAQENTEVRDLDEWHQEKQEEPESSEYWESLERWELQVHRLMVFEEVRLRKDQDDPVREVGTEHMDLPVWAARLAVAVQEGGPFVLRPVWVAMEEVQC